MFEPNNNKVFVVTLFLAAGMVFAGLVSLGDGSESTRAVLASDDASTASEDAGMVTDADSGDGSYSVVISLELTSDDSGASLPEESEESEESEE